MVSIKHRQAFSVPILLLTIISIIPGGSCSAEQSSLQVFSSAGSKPAVDLICRQYQEKYGPVIEVTYGGGGEVLSQMALSRSGDIYISPEQKFMEAATEKQAILPETIRTVAYMIPVIAVQKGNPKNIRNLEDLAGTGVKVGITRQETTLLGKYAPEIFSRAGLYEKIRRNIVTEAARPDNLLTMLIMGQIDAGITWHFYQAQSPDKIENVYLLPEQLTGIGEMQVAVSAYSHDEKPVLKFLEFITSDEGKRIFKETGYLTSEKEVQDYLP